MAALDLPTGRNGRILAVLIALLLLALFWTAVAAPLIGWHDQRQEVLEQRQLLARRMAILVQRLPALRAQAAAMAASGQASAGALIEGNSDAVASASIQEKVAAMASGLGLSLSSTETLAATREGAYRRVGVRVSLDAAFPVVVHLLQSIEAAQPSLLVNDLQIHGTRLLGQSDSAPLNVAFTVIGFRRFDASVPEPVGPPADASGGDGGGDGSNE